MYAVVSRTVAGEPGKWKGDVVARFCSAPDILQKTDVLICVSMVVRNRMRLYVFNALASQLIPDPLACPADPQGLKESRIASKTESVGQTRFSGLAWVYLRKTKSGNKGLEASRHSTDHKWSWVCMTAYVFSCRFAPWRLDSTWKEGTIRPGDDLPRW